MQINSTITQMLVIVALRFSAWVSCLFSLCFIAVISTQHRVSPTTCESFVSGRARDATRTHLHVIGSVNWRLFKAMKCMVKWQRAAPRPDGPGWDTRQRQLGGTTSTVSAARDYRRMKARDLSLHCQVIVVLLPEWLSRILLTWRVITRCDAGFVSQIIIRCI